MPMATVGAPFSMRVTVSGEQVARSATCDMLKFLRKRASLICSPTTCIFCSNLRGSFVPIVFFAIYSKYHIICKSNNNCLFNDILSEIYFFFLFTCNILPFSSSFCEFYPFPPNITSQKSAGSFFLMRSLRLRMAAVVVCPRWARRVLEYPR